MNKKLILLILILIAEQGITIVAGQSRSVIILSNQGCVAEAKNLCYLKWIEKKPRKTTDIYSLSSYESGLKTIKNKELEDYFYSSGGSVKNNIVNDWKKELSNLLIKRGQLRPYRLFFYSTVYNGNIQLNGESHTVYKSIVDLEAPIRSCLKDNKDFIIVIPHEEVETTLSIDTVEIVRPSNSTGLSTTCNISDYLIVWKKEHGAIDYEIEIYSALSDKLIKSYSWKEEYSKIPDIVDHCADNLNAEYRDTTKHALFLIRTIDVCKDCDLPLPSNYHYTTKLKNIYYLRIRSVKRNQDTYKVRDGWTQKRQFWFMDC
jgi:hypothetical protein